MTGPLRVTEAVVLAAVAHPLRRRLLEVVPELARDRRERWWRMVRPGLTWDDADVGDDPATAAAVSARGFPATP